MRMLLASSTSARSLCSAMMRFTRVRDSYTILPEASRRGTDLPFSSSFICILPVGRMPKRMTFGPMLISSAFTSASTRKLCRVSWMIFASAVVSSPNMCSLTSSGLLSNLMSGSFQGGSCAGCASNNYGLVIAHGIGCERLHLRFVLVEGELLLAGVLYGVAVLFAIQGLSGARSSRHEANLVFVQVDVVERVICSVAKVVLELDQ